MGNGHGLECLPYPNGKGLQCSEVVSPTSLSRLHITREPPVYTSEPMFTYTRGDEMKLRDQLAALDAAESFSIWIVTADGPDGDAARGLTRTLVKELPAWKIHLVVCDPTWTDRQRRSAVAKLQDLPTVEPEIKLDAQGMIHVPRVVPLPSPSKETAFEKGQHWVSDDGKIAHTTLGELGPQDVAVNVSHWSSLDANFPRAFIGTVTNKGESEFALGDWVMGITDAKISNQLAVHAGSVVACQPKHCAMLSDAPGFATAVLALGPGTIRRAGRLAAIRHALVCDAHTSVGQAAARFYVQLGLDVFCIAEGDAVALSKSLNVPVGRVSVASNATWVARQRCLYDVVLSGARRKADVQVVSQLITPRGMLHLWNGEQRGLVHDLEHDPWNVALALEVVLEALPNNFKSSKTPIAIADAVPISSKTLVPSVAPLFDGRKTYLLIGGIGGLGVQLALWMYEVGITMVIGYLN